MMKASQNMTSLNDRIRKIWWSHFTVISTIFSSDKFWGSHAHCLSYLFCVFVYSSSCLPSPHPLSFFLFFLRSVRRDGACRGGGPHRKDGAYWRQRYNKKKIISINTFNVNNVSVSVSVSLLFSPYYGMSIDRIEMN